MGLGMAVKQAWERVAGVPRVQAEEEGAAILLREKAAYRGTSFCVGRRGRSGTPTP